jgi:hypothetical protein
VVIKTSFRVRYSTISYIISCNRHLEKETGYGKPATPVKRDRRVRS